MAEKQCNLLKNGGGTNENKGNLVTFTPNHTDNLSNLVKLGNVVIGKIYFTNSNNSMTYTAHTVIGTVPYKPTKNVNVLLELSGNVTLVGTTVDINTNGQIISNASISNGRYFATATFMYFTND